MLTLHQGDNVEVLKSLPAGSVQTCVTITPYWGLRDYGHSGQIGLERRPDHYASRLVAVFREVRRVLKDDGTLWLNLGDTYCASGKGSKQVPQTITDKRGARCYPHDRPHNARLSECGLKGKDLVGIPWMVAFALRDDGWYLRSDIIWNKPNCLPESVRDRPTKAHEYIFLLSKRPRYYYDQSAIREPVQASTITRYGSRTHGSRRKSPSNDPRVSAINQRLDRPGHKEKLIEQGRNKRTVWNVSLRPYHGAHFATFPPQLIEPCILAGAPPGGLVLDPFSGAGSTGLAALKHGRAYVGIELNPEYVSLCETRLREAGFHADNLGTTE